MLSDSELVTGCRRGERKAFSELMRRHYGTVRRIALSFAAIPEDADDLTQEAFIAAYERLDQLADPGRFASWLAAIVRNTKEMASWSLTSLKEKVIKVGARLVMHARRLVFQMAEVSLTRGMLAQILDRIRQLEPVPC